jgi:hypothetical protein
MRVPDYSKQILALAELLHRWVGQLMKLDGVRREKVARYAEEIAATLARAAEAHLTSSKRSPAMGRRSGLWSGSSAGFQGIWRRSSACCIAILTGASLLALKGGLNSFARLIRGVLPQVCPKPTCTTRPSTGRRRRRATSGLWPMH